MEWTIGTNSYQLVSANFWTHQLTVWWRKLSNKIFRRYYIAFRTSSQNIDMMASKSKKWDQKIKKMSAGFPFCRFPLCPFYPTGIKIGSERPQHVLKHAEKQWETPSVQSFGAKSEACVVKPPAQQFKNQIELKILVVYRTLYKSFVGIE